MRKGDLRHPSKTATSSSLHKVEIDRLRRTVSYQKKIINELRTSLSFRIGWFITAPARHIYTLYWAVRNGESFRQIFQNFLHLLFPSTFSQFKTKIGNSVSSYDDHQEHEYGMRRVARMNSGKESILYVTLLLPDFDASSGGRRATEILKILAEDFNVVIYCMQEDPTLKYREKLSRLGIQIYFQRNLKEFKAQVRHIDLILFNFFNRYWDCKFLLDLFPMAAIAIDSVDLHYIREERLIGLSDEYTIDKVEKNKELELSAYEAADIVWVVSEKEKDLLQQELPGLNTWVVSNIHAEIALEYKDPGTNDMIFIGGFWHVPNVFAVEHIARRLVPAIRAKISDARLLIVGTNAPDNVRDLAKIDGVEFLGQLCDEDLASLYSQVFLSICPLQAGAGVKGKICEAISYRVPVATNSIGNEGLDLTLDEAFISDHDEELVQMIVGAMLRQRDLDEMTSRAIEKLRNLVEPHKVRSVIMRSMRFALNEDHSYLYSLRDLLQISYDTNTLHPRIAQHIEQLLLADNKFYDFEVVQCTSKNEYDSYKGKTRSIQVKRREFEREIWLESDRKQLDLPIFNPVTQSYKNVHVDNAGGYQVYNNVTFPNWRESLIDPVSGLNGRMRAAYLFLLSIVTELPASPEVYTTEAKTHFFKVLKSRWPNMMGSEFFGSDYAPGSLVNGIRHEDITRLTFSNYSFDLILCLEVMEHVPDYKLALQELYRVMKPGGILILSIPFKEEQEKNQVRATVDALGNIDYLKSPEYHGDPVRPDAGALCYHDFGWEFLDDLKSVGFKEVSINYLWSLYFGVLGENVNLFYMRK